jgi:hypothetical protein
MRIRLKTIVSKKENVISRLIKKKFLKLEKKKKKKKKVIISATLRMVNDNQTHSITMQVSTLLVIGHACY